MILPTMRIISLGWGVQSFALAAMSALGVLPHVDYCIHADTGHERSSTYAFARRWTPWLEEHNIPVITGSPADGNAIIKNGDFPVIPAFVQDGQRDGILQRQCTYNWKIRVVRHWVQRVRSDRPVELWIGITADEIIRVRDSGVSYIKHRWPFLEPELRGGRMLTRRDVHDWLRRELGEEAIPTRSACYFCPSQSPEDWRSLRGTPDWERALAIDEQLRHMFHDRTLYLYRGLIPLSELGSDDAPQQIDLFGKECSGACGI